VTITKFTDWEDIRRRGYVGKANQSINEELRQILLDMAAEDRRARAELAATGELFQGYAPRMAAIHLHHAQELKVIIRTWGWPGKSLVGEDGAQAAWLIVQHAIGWPDFQRTCLSLLQDAVARGELEPATIAYLEDRICFYERRPQRYGTQFDWDEHGQMSPWTLADPQRVDEYRCSVGLGPLAKQIEQARQATEDQIPPDYAKRQQEFTAWAKSVGWL
jgi:hypothetical protein